MYASHEQEMTLILYGNSIIGHMTCRGWTQITSALGIKKTKYSCAVAGGGAAVAVVVVVAAVASSLIR